MSIRGRRRCQLPLGWRTPRHAAWEQCPSPHCPHRPQLDYMPFDARTKRTESTVRDPEGREFKARAAQPTAGEPRHRQHHTTRSALPTPPLPTHCAHLSSSSRPLASPTPGFPFPSLASPPSSLASPSSPRQVTKGAPHVILALLPPCEAAKADEVAAAVTALGGRGIRALAVARTDTPQGVRGAARGCGRGGRCCGGRR